MGYSHLVASTVSHSTTGPATILSHKCEFPLLSRDDHIAHDNRLPVQCRQVALPVILLSSQLPRTCQKSFRNPNHHWSQRKYCSTPPICKAVRPPFVSLYLPGFYGLKKGIPNGTFVLQYASQLFLQYASYLYSCFFEKVRGVGVTGKLLNMP